MAHNADGSDPRPEVPPRLHVARPDEATPADEATMLRGWLTHLRESAIFKLDGLDDAQLRWKPAPTANSLGGIVVHLGYAERLWARVVFAGEAMDLSWTEDRYAPTFVVPDGWSVDDVVAFYRAESAATDAVLDEAPSFDLPSRGRMRPTTLRWVVTHLVEETARHVGHMDITRELLDGRTGR
ncbi:MAG TPA: DinB family protein [Acidimicrobiales bacterium]|nr:DinB family protein [Acidimicrobiales bacterium]